MRSAMDSIKEMIDVNTVVGDPVEAQDGSVIIPVSRVSFGFGVGGGEYGQNESDEGYPFGGGSGAGVTVQPVGFLVVGNGAIRFLSVSGPAILDRLIDITPQLLECCGFHKCQEPVTDPLEEINAT
ncbi:MAG TPA: sporulation protein YtfJ [Firmicutes bacterium]|nr:sporulation protein YtfJ [Bacillota bacterium]